jgi:hypothetical protein
VTEEKVSRVPLCRVHFTEMRLADIVLSRPSEIDTHEAWTCSEAACLYAFSKTSGYFKYVQGGKINSEKGPVCPEHHRPLYIYDYDSQSGTVSWQCPHPACKTHKKGPVEP